jgi:hypothetical protein
MIALMDLSYRWTPRRKAQILDDIAAGRISRAAALKVYALSDEELDEWRRRFAAGKLAGLKVSGKRRKSRKGAA